MRLPDLAGYRLEKLMGEDPFGWNFLAGKSPSDKRLVRILKSQATQDQSISDIYRHLLPLSGSAGIPDIDKFSRRMVGMPSAISLHFPGWQSSQGKWRLSSVARLLPIMEASGSGALACAEGIVHTLADLHQRQIFHGGIHPDNLFLTGVGEEPVVKLTGFGERVMPGLQHIEAAHLPFFVAPEQLLANPPPSTVAKWDVYSAGVIIFQLLTHHLPRLDRWYRQFLESPDQLSRVLLVANGSLTENAGKIFRLLESEKDLVWPSQHASPREKILRTIAEGCLAFDPANRLPNMVEAHHLLVSFLQQTKPEAQTPVVSAPLVLATAAPITQRVSQRKPQVSPPVTQSVLQIAPQVTPPVRSVTPIPGIGPVESPSPVLVSESATKGERVAPKSKGSLELAKARSSGDSPGLLEKIPFIRRFKSSSVLDKIIALLVGVAVIGLTCTTFFFMHQAEMVEKQKESKVAEMANDFKEQAAQLRTMINERERSSLNIKENLNVVEDSKAQLLGEAKLAREMLRQTQENGDHFFRLVLENADSDVPDFRKHRAEALLEGKKHYQRLIEIYGDSSDFTASTADAFYYLGRINREIGDYESAEEAFSESEKRYLSLMEEDKKPEHAQNLAISKREMGELALRVESYADASHFFDKSNTHWQELSQWDRSRQLEAAIEINSNSLEIVKCHYALGHRDEALKGANDVATQFLALQKSYSDEEKVIGGLAKVFAFLGSVYENSGDGEKALKSFQQASDLFAEAVRCNSAVDEYRLGLGDSLARVGLMKNDTAKLKGAADVLALVVARNSDQPMYLKTLADVYGVLASHQRDGGKLKNAIEFEEQAIALLKPTIEAEKNIPLELYHAYSQRLVHLAELRVDGGKFDDSRLPLKEAIEVLSQISQVEGARPAFRRTLATARGLAGFASLKSGDKSSAKQFYQLASADWSSYLESNPGDGEAVKSARWAKDQLNKLK